MLFLKKCLETSFSCIYLAIENRYIDRLFWRALGSGPRYTQNLVCNLRWYQIRVLNLLESKIDNEALHDLSRKIKLLFTIPNSTSSGRQQIHILPSFKDRKNPGALNKSSDSNFPFSKAETGLDNFPKISIVTPNYNQGKFLEKCIKSVLSQNYPNVEHIIIDGGSTDDSIDIIKKYEDKITFWVSEKDDGQADAINKGLKHVSGVIFNWLNSDDYLEQGALLRCAKAYKKNPSVVGWVGGCRRIDTKGKVLSVIYPHSLNREDIGQNWYGSQFYQPSCFLSTKRVKEVGGLDQNLLIALDLDLWIKILGKGEFVSGKGIWSNAIIHADAKTQSLRLEVSLETSKVQNKYGFIEGANIRDKIATKRGAFRYTLPTYLKNKSKLLRQAYRIQNGILKEPKSVTFVSDSFPRFDRQGLELRLFTILKILLTNGCIINYIYTSPAKCPMKYIRAFKGDLKVYHVPSKHDSLLKVASENKADYFWIIPSKDTDDLGVKTKFGHQLKERAPRAKIIVDMAHFSAQKFLTNRELSKTDKGVLDERQSVENTLKPFELAHRIVVSNNKEKLHIEEMLSRKQKVQVVPHVYEILDWGLPFTRRRNICFFGAPDFNHHADDPKYFLDDIFDSISILNPSLEFHLIANDLGILRDTPKSTRFKILAARKNLPALLLNYKLCIFPVGYTNSDSDAFGIAAATGVPIITSKIAAESYPVNDGSECFIADSPEEFAEKCNQCLRDPTAWRNFRIKSQLMIAENNSPEVVAKKLVKLLSK
jgi:glycosyltransferase involved in cell wall biosynthesis